MINRKYILLLAAAALLTLAGCHKDPGPSDGGSITVEASIGAQTKVTYVGDGSTFAEGDRIAVYAWTGSASAVPDTRVVNGVVNTLGSSGWTPASEMRWKNLTDAHYFLGVSPVHTIADFSAGEYALGTESYAAGDLLVATVLGEGRKASGGAVPLGFKHVMARLSVNVKLGNEFATSDASGVTVLAKKLATVNYLSQTASAPGSASASELPLFAESSAPSGYALSYSAPQVPQEGVRQITVSVAGMDYVYTSDSDIPLVSGKHTTVNLVVGKDRVELSDVSVSDWGDGGSLAGGEAVVVKPSVPYLTFTSEGTTTVSLKNYGGNAPKLYYSYDASNWTEWDYSILSFTSSAPLYLCGDNPDGFSFSSTKYSILRADGDKFSVSGDIMSLIDKDAECKVIPNAFCFYLLFYCCSPLTQAPALPATTLAANCYYDLFYGCTGLKTAPALPATTLAENCYSYMFYGCTGLTTAPALPATTLANYCYRSMFVDCTGLTAAPALPATTLAENCYRSMFASCTGLTAAPALPATTLAAYCYTNMFSDCTSLTTAPELPASTVLEGSYLTMFNGCIELNYVKCLAKDISAMYSVDSWLEGVATSGTFIKAKGINWPPGPSGIPENWTVEERISVSQYLTFTSEGTTTISLKNYAGNAPKLYYSTNTSDWAEWDYSALTFSSGAPLYLCGDNPDGFCYDNNKSSRFADGGSSYSVSGSIMSLLNKETAIEVVPNEYCFYDLFNSCTGLTAAPELPATTLANSCYFDMFEGCTGLTTAPELPATTLANRCYSDMFGGCTGLTVAPELPATTLTDHCYANMFEGCTGLTAAPELPATTLAEWCYAYMFEGCTGLTTAPELPATTLPHSCYTFMFNGCKELNYVKCLANNISAMNCVDYWLEGVAASGTFIKDAKTKNWKSGASGIPEGWTVVNAE